MNRPSLLSRLGRQLLNTSIPWVFSIRHNTTYATLTHHASRWQPSTLDRFLHQGDGHAIAKTSENPEYKYSLAFVGYGSNPDHAELELTYNWGVESYDMGTAYGHLAIAVPDAYEACEKIRNAGGKVTREAGPVKGGTTVIAFVTDPDGYKVELIQRNFS